MSASNPGPVRRFFRALWRFIDASRRVVLNLVFLVILVAIAVALIKTGPAPIADKTALVLRLDGTISEQKTGTLRSSALDQVRGEAVQKILLRDVLAALDSAAADPKISSLVVILDEMRPTGFSTLREIAAGSTASRRAARRSSPGARRTTSASTTSLRTPTSSTCIRSAWSTSPASAACATTTRTRSTSSASPST